MTTAALASAHEQFEAALPAIRQSARYALRRRRRDREDLLAEVIACAWKAWHGLVDRGRNPVAVGVTAIASWAARHALKGRRIGNRFCGRGAMDIFHRRAQSRCSFRVVSYDSNAAPPSGSGARDLEGLAGRRPSRQPGRRGVFPAGFPGLALAPARTAAEDGRVAGPRRGDPRGRPVGGDLAGGHQPGPRLARAELAGFPGRNVGGRVTTATALHAHDPLPQQRPRSILNGRSPGKAVGRPFSSSSSTRRRPAHGGAARLPDSPAGGLRPCGGSGAGIGRHEPAVNPR